MSKDDPQPSPKDDAWVNTLWYEDKQSALECWDKVIDDILRKENGSMAFLPLPEPITDELNRAWEILADIFSQASEIQEHNPSFTRIDDSADSAHCTGYHASSPGFSRRYNAHRRGWVFSDDAWTCSISEEESITYLNQQKQFDDAMSTIRAVLHFILDNLLRALSRHWELTTDCSCWFQAHMGPTRSHSQWHVKEFVTPPNLSDTVEVPHPQEWLAAHTDPSLLSVVIHDTQNQQMCGSRGLQYCSEDKQWYPASPPTTTTPNQQYATIFVGSVLAAMTNHQVSACRHRVLYDHSSQILSSDLTRRAATLFGRPAPTAKLQHIPGFPRIRQEGMRFEDWLSRVARNYEKSKKSSKK